jgi:hypothetical protein
MNRVVLLDFDRLTNSNHLYKNRYPDTDFWKATKFKTQSSKKKLRNSNRSKSPTSTSLILNIIKTQIVCFVCNIVCLNNRNIYRCTLDQSAFIWELN